MHLLSCAVILQAVASSYMAAGTGDLIVNYTYSSLVIKYGNIVSPLQTLLPPTIGYSADINRWYTLVCEGPDMPLDQTSTYSQAAHWMVTNIPGSNVTQGTKTFPYSPPVPALTKANYTFNVYEQPAIFNQTEKNYMSFNLSNPSFNLSKFVSDYGLIGPVATNSMIVSYAVVIPTALQVAYSIIAGFLKG